MRFPRRCRCQPLLGSWLLGLRWGRKKCPPWTIRGGRFGSEASWRARARQTHAGGSCRRASNTAAAFGGKMCALRAMDFGQRCGAILQKTRSEPWCVGWGSGFFLRGVPREQKESPPIVLYRCWDFLLFWSLKRTRRLVNEWPPDSRFVSARDPRCESPRRESPRPESRGPRRLSPRSEVRGPRLRRERPVTAQGLCHTRSGQQIPPGIHLVLVMMTH